MIGVNADRKTLLVDVLFYASGPGSRSTAPDLSRSLYCPHFIIKGSKNYLGVRFVDGDTVSLGDWVNAVIETIYDGVDYGALLSGGAEFYIAEGGNIVGEGRVVWVEMNP